MQFVKECTNCGHKLSLKTGLSINCICQQCGNYVFTVNEDLYADCEICNFSRSLVKSEAYRAIHKCKKGDSTTFVFKSELDTLEEESIEIDTSKRFKIVIPYYEGGDRIKRALDTWLIPEVVFFLTDELIIPPGSGICNQIYSKFSSKSLVGDETLPVFPEILKKLMYYYPDEDFYGVFNTDTILPFGTHVSSLLPAPDKIASIHHRSDLKGTDLDRIRDMKNVGSIVVGKDGFILRKDIAEVICQQFPDMIMGMPFWDTALATHLTREYGEEKIDYCFGEIQHVYHKSNKEAKDQYNTEEGKHNHIEGSKVFKGAQGQVIWDRIVNSTQSERKKIKRKRIGIIQPGRLGDIFICLPIAKYYYDKGYQVIWPVFQDYLRYFDYVNYVKPIPLPTLNGAYQAAYATLTTKEKLDAEEIIDLGIGFGLPDDPWILSGLTFDDWKYRKANVPYSEKYNLSIKRNKKKEDSLFRKLGCHKFEDGYVVVSQDSSFASFNFKIPTAIKVDYVSGYTLFDWIKVFEEARYLYMVDSAPLNLVNQLGIGKDRRYYRTWHDIREQKEADRLTPHMGEGWKKTNPVTYKDRVYPEYINDNNASSHILNTAKKYCKGEGVDLGGGRNPFPGASNIDIITGSNVNHILVEGLGYNDLDFVFSSHFLEHVLDYEAVLEECYNALKEEGILFLYLPHPDNEYWHPDNLAMQGEFGHKHIMDPDTVKEAVRKAGFKLVKSSTQADHYYSWYLVAKKSKAKKSQMKKAKPATVNKQPNIAFLTIVYNGMPWLQHAMQQVENFAHQIIVVEGKVKKWKGADQYSSDGTVEFVERAMRRRFAGRYDFYHALWTSQMSKMEMQNVGLDMIAPSADYVWLLDYDEIWPEEYIQKVIDMLASEKDISQVNFKVTNFFKDTNRIISGGERYERKTKNIPRIFRLDPGESKFIKHRPPTLQNNQGRLGRVIQGTDIEEALGVTMLHFSYMTDKQILQKIQLYQNTYKWRDHLLLENWYKKFFCFWTPEEEEELLRGKEYGAWVGDKDSRTIEYKGILPEQFR